MLLFVSILFLHVIRTLGPQYNALRAASYPSPVQYCLESSVDVSAERPHRQAPQDQFVQGESPTCCLSLSRALVREHRMPFPYKKVLVVGAVSAFIDIESISNDLIDMLFGRLAVSVEPWQNASYRTESK